MSTKQKYLMKLREKCKNDYNLNPEVLPILIEKLPNVELEQKRFTYSEFLSFEKQFMKKIIRDIGFIPVLIVISDSEGCIIEMYGDESIKHQVHLLGIKTGVQFNEEYAGINAISMALKLGEPVQLLGKEHYHTCLQQTACISIPFQFAETITGTISLMTTMEHVQSSHLHVLFSAVNIAKSYSQSEQLYKLYYKEIYQYLYRMTRNEELAKDLCQETFIKVLNAIQSVDEDKSVKAWIYRIAHNTFVSWYRKKKRIDFINIDTQKFEFKQKSYKQPERYMEESELYEELAKSISRLKEDYQVVLILREFQGLSYQEIADVLGWKLSKVKTNIHRARAQLRNFLVG
ncbi:sigma-70 family RNA polymerase sigma factor [Aquibacillus sediminis]|uniref:sigma-70 family RNA polymerase sigma factor n=1 Tax=Aquibacillus sediminis TaxID=2574734 RepID=UPI001FE38CCF|nr:sigma-70 family RNA polymerase sigma factor [Aquibacillus sediminis]